MNNHNLVNLRRLGIPGNGFEVKSLGPEQVHAVLRVPAGLDDGHLGLKLCF